MHHERLAQPAPELANSAIVDHYGRRFLVSIEREADNVTPYDCDLPQANSPTRCAAWERGDWHYVRMQVVALDSRLTPLDIERVETTRAYPRLPSDGDLSGYACRLCAELTFVLNTLPVPPG